MYKCDQCPCSYSDYDSLQVHRSSAHTTLTIAGLSKSDTDTNVANKDFDAFLDAELDKLINAAEWSVQVPGSPAIDRAKEDKAKAEARARITREVLALVGDDDPIERRNAHIDIEREGRNKLRAELRRKLGEQKGTL